MTQIKKAKYIKCQVMVLLIYCMGSLTYLNLIFSFALFK